MTKAERHNDQIDFPGDLCIWPTYWARSPYAEPDSPPMVHSWNASGPSIGHIGDIRTKERAALIVTAVGSHDALVAALKTVETALFADAEAGKTNVGRGKFESADDEQHPWIPGARAWAVIETVRTALKLAEGESS